MQYDPNHKFKHFRRPDVDGSIDPRSGATVAYYVKDGKLFCSAAYCGPRDNFSYALGRIKSSARLGYFVDHPEKEDGNIHFTFNIDGDDVASAVRAISDFMVDGLGYSPRYESKETVEAA